ncbi:MAG: PTS sugar transporter subunit IIA [Terrimicrobiaceae bacterium]|nr:PTS sugar transporter subunit IIA [Terrimicrobiaceae bacterium]
MTILSEALPPHRVRLGLHAASTPEALEAVLEILRDAPRLRDFNELVAAVRSRNAAVTGNPGREILIAHGRTESAERLLLAAGRFDEDSAACGVPRLVFVAGIPAAFNTEYLRAVGAVARACSAPGGYEALLAAPTASDFCSLIEAAELAI